MRTNEVVVTISAPKITVAVFRIVGSAPYMQEAFPSKVQQMMAEKMRAGSTAKKGKKRDARDFDADFLGAHHFSTEGWVGIPAPAFRAACVDACRLVGFHMTTAKMSVFVDADGFDRQDATPLVRLIADAPEMSIMPVRNATGVVDLRARPVWREWACDLRVRFDMDQFTLVDVTNLLSRAGSQVGVGAGRPFSKKSNGLGFGTWRVDNVTAHQE